MFDIIYYWYDHLELRHNGDAEIVQTAIKNKDYSTFMKYYNKYGNDYFPRTATIFSKKSDEILGTLDITKQEVFELIDHSEYECG